MELQLTSTRWDDGAMQILQQEFYGKYSVDESMEMISRDMANESSALFASDSIQKATDVFFQREEGVVVAILALKYYRWALLGPQLFFEVVLSEGETIAFSLKPMNQLVGSTEAVFAGELAYFWVSPSYRGHGIGRKLFAYTVSRFREQLSSGDVAFTLSLGNKSHLYAGRDLKKLMLQHEEAVSGVDEKSGLIRVRSTPLALSTVEDQLGFPVSEIGSSDGSIATEVLARKFGMAFRGYSRNLSLLFASVVSDLS